MKNRYLRVKASVKRRLDISPSHSSTSLPDLAQPTGSPGPLTTQHAAPPLPNDPDAKISDPSSSSATSPPAPVGEGSPQVSISADAVQDEPAASQRADSASTAPIPDNLSLANPKPAPEDNSAPTLDWPGLSLLLKALDSTAGIFPPFRAVIGEFGALVQVFEIASKQRDGYSDLRETLDTLLGDISQHLGGMANPTMTMSMKNLCTGINTELRIIGHRLTRGTLQRHIEAVEDPDQVLECYRRIQGHLERLSLNANLSIWETVDELAREARLRLLSPTTSAVYNSAKSGEIQRRGCTHGTRQEELTKLLDWARNKDCEEVYWVNGMAGTGKTTIAYSLCTELERTAELGASFFCSRLIPECRDVKLIIPAIAYQLARFSFPFCSALLKVLKADPDVHTRVLETQFESLVVKPLLEVKHTLPLDFVVVIDALDECEHVDSVGQILDVLLSHTTAHASHLPIRFLLSSRPEPEIYSRMMNKYGTDHEARLVLHELDKNKVQHDINTYLKIELEQVGLTESQLAALVAHSGVLFIYASTAARYIKGGLRSRQHETRLNMILGLNPPSSNGKDRDIDALYLSILKNAFEHQDLDSSDQNLMKAILDTIICAQEPLTIDGIAGLLGLRDVYQVDGLLGSLRSVLNIGEKTGLVTTLHTSFPDFMCDNARSTSFHCDFRKVHARLARSCFAIFGANDPQFNVCALRSSYIRDEEVFGLAKRLEEAISPQLFYACRYWVTHLKLGDEREEAQDLVHGFLAKQLLLWMEVLNLNENMHLGPRIMQAVENWSRTYHCPNETINLAHDAWRFVTMYASHSVSQSTPHIYVSMLSFWPESTPIAKHYAQRLRGAIRVDGLAMTRRQLAPLSTWSFPNNIYSVCLSRSGNLIAYAIGSFVCIIDGTTGRPVLGPLEHDDMVSSVEFSPDGTVLVSGSNDKTVRLWRTSNGHPLSEPFVGHTDWVTCVSFSRNGKYIVSGSLDGIVHVWGIESGRALQRFDDFVWSICISPDSTRIASGYSSGTIHIWDTESGKMLIGPLQEHTKRVSTICFSPDNTILASGSGDCTIRLWSNLTGNIHVDVLEGHTRAVASVTFSPDGKQLVSGSLDFTVRLWDLKGTPRLARIFEGHTNVVFCVRFSSDGTRLVSSSGDSTIRVWDPRSQNPSDSPLEGHTQVVTSVAFLHDGTRIVSGSNDETIRVWDIRSGQVALGPMKGHTDWVNSVCVSPDGSRIASGSRDETVQLWDAYTGQAVGKPLVDHSGRVFSVCFLPDGALLASGSEDATIRLWDAKSGEPVGEPLAAHKSWVRSVHFSSDSLKLVSGADDQVILVWDVSTRKTILPPITGHSDQVWVVCTSPDGTRIASGSMDTTVRLWDANSGQSAFGPLVGHSAIVYSVCFSPDSSYIVSGSNDKTIRLWDARTGQTVGSPLTGHTDLVRSVTFSPDGGQIISGSNDLSIRVWDVADLVQARETQDHTEKDTKSPHAHKSWVLQDNGWVVDSQSRLLAWVPPDLHTNLMNPRNPLLISAKGSIKLDLESAKLGESWTDCYQP